MHPMVICSYRAFRTLKEINKAVQLERWCLQRHESYAQREDPKVMLSTRYGVGQEKGGGFRISLLTEQGVRGGGENVDEYSGRVVLDFFLDYDNSALFQLSFSFDVGDCSWSIGQMLDHSYRPVGDANMAAGLVKILGRELDSRTVSIANNQGAMDMIGTVADYVYKRYADKQLVAA